MQISTKSPELDYSLQIMFKFDYLLRNAKANVYIVSTLTQSTRCVSRHEILVLFGKYIKTLSKITPENENAFTVNIFALKFFARGAEVWGATISQSQQIGRNRFRRLNQKLLGDTFGRFSKIISAQTNENLGKQNFPKTSEINSYI